MRVPNDKMIEVIRKVDPSKLTFLHPECVDNFSNAMSEDFLRLFSSTLDWLNDQALLTTDNVIALYLRWGNFFKDNFFHIEAINAAYSEFKNASNYAPAINLNIDQQKLFNFLVTLVRPELTARFLLKAQVAKALDQDFFDTLVTYFTPMTNEKLQHLYAMQESVFMMTRSDAELGTKLGEIKRFLTSPPIVSPGSLGFNAASMGANSAQSNPQPHSTDNVTFHH